MKQFSHNDPYTQADVQAASLDFANKVVRKNLYSVNVAGHMLGYVLFVAGRVAMCPMHFFDFVKTKI